MRDQPIFLGSRIGAVPLISYEFGLDCIIRNFHGLKANFPSCKTYIFVFVNDSLNWEAQTDAPAPTVQGRWWPW